MPVKSYIVRIYRTGKAGTGTVVGVVERAGTAEKRTFTTMHELWDFLTAACTRRSEPARADDLD